MNLYDYFLWYGHDEIDGFHTIREALDRAINDEQTTGEALVQHHSGEIVATIVAGEWELRGAEWWHKP